MIHCGLLQGGLLSPQIFNVVAESFCNKLKEWLEELQIPFEIIQFADDTTIFYDDQNHEKIIKDTFDEILRGHGLKLNANKTKSYPTSESIELLGGYVGRDLKDCAQKIRSKQMAKGK